MCSPGRIAPRLLSLAIVVMAALNAVGSQARAETASPLFARGYTVLPTPQNVKLSGKDFAITSGWRLELASGITPGDVAVTMLKEELRARYQLTLAEGRVTQSVPGEIRLSLAPGSVTVGKAADHDKASLAEQAYRLVLKPQSIQIIANASPGLL